MGYISIIDTFSINNKLLSKIRQKIITSFLKKKKNPSLEKNELSISQLVVAALSLIISFSLLGFDAVAPLPRFAKGTKFRKQT